MKHVIRPIEKNDLDAFEQFANTMSIGVTSLPKDRDLLIEKIDRSNDAFLLDRQHPHGDLYLFVLEDVETKELIGTSGIKAMTGVFEPSYFYHLDFDRIKSDLPHVPESQPILRTISYENGPTEICGLYLLPEKREGKLGKLLSYSRFLFIGAHPKRFGQMLIATMRGFIDENGQSPFWTQVGQHFFDVDFKTALNLFIYSRKFIPNILPSYPLYVSLLPKMIQELLGKTHPNTEPALRMLYEEGFSFANEIDIFDGGPKIAAFTHEIKTIREAGQGIIHEIVDDLSGEREYMIANYLMDFRAGISFLAWHDEDRCLLTKEAASLLKVKEGDAVRAIAH